MAGEVDGAAHSTHASGKADLGDSRWYVKQIAPVDPLHAVSHKGLVAAVKGHGKRILSDERVDVIARPLKAACRDVKL